MILESVNRLKVCRPGHTVSGTPWFWSMVSKFCSTLNHVSNVFVYTVHLETTIMDPLLGSEFPDRCISELRVTLTVMKRHTTKTPTLFELFAYNANNS